MNGDRQGAARAVLVAVCVVAVPLLAVMGLLSLSLLTSTAEAPVAACQQQSSAPAVVLAASTQPGSGGSPASPPVVGGSGVRLPPADLPAGPVSGYSGVQLVNAWWIVSAAKDLGLPERAQVIGVMTAMGESGLRVLGYGDRVGPDSRGLFQQRGNGAWGSLADRMDPYRSAVSFFTALKRVFGWELLEPTIAAHRVQRNQDPQYYARYWPAALEVVAAVTGKAVADPSALGSAGGTDGSADSAVSALAAQCAALMPAAAGDAGGAGGAGSAGVGDVPVTPGAWVVPARGPITSPYGPRTDPITGASSMHTGTDLGGGGCDGPIWAAHAGTVTRVWQDTRGGWTVSLDHGGGLATSYKHMFPKGIFVHVGNVVKAGQRIAAVGSSGWSTACHLHFEAFINGSRVDPVPFMRAHGVTLGASP